MRVAGIVACGELRLGRERRRRHVVGAAPEHELLVAELVPGLLLALALERAVVALVEPPRAATGIQGRPPPPARARRCWIARVSTEVCTTRAAGQVAQQLAAATASASPSDSPTSTQPVNRPSAFHVLSPWRSRTSRSALMP